MKFLDFLTRHSFCFFLIIIGFGQTVPEALPQKFLHAGTRQVMPDESIIRQATIADRNQICGLLEQAYKGRSEFKFPHRWHWQFVNNPYWNGEQLPIWLAIRYGEILGQVCLMPVALSLGGKVYEAGWGVDFIVLPDYRGQNLGTQLELARLRSAGKSAIMMSLFMSPSSRKIKMRLGGKPGASVSVFRKRLKIGRETICEAVHTRVSERKILHRIWTFSFQVLRFDAVLASIANAAITLPHLPRKRVAKIPDFTIKEIDRFEEDMDRLWEKTSGQYKAIVKRDSKYLNWKYTEQPHMRYRKFIALVNHEVRGYLVLRKTRPPEPRVGIIADIYAGRTDSSVLKEMVAFCIDFFSGEVPLIKCATSIKELEDIFLAFSFSKGEELTQLLYTDDQDLRERLNEAKGGWFLSLGDTDWDQFPLAQE